MKKKILPILALGSFGLASYAGTYMVVTKSDGTVVEYNVNDVDSVSYRTCRCECDLPVVKGWSYADGTKGGNSNLIPSGSTIVFKGSGLSEITSVTFDDEEAEISFPLSTDDQLVLKVPTVTKETGYARFHTKMCKDGFEAYFYVDDISNMPPCVSMCDNEFAVKTLKVKGTNLFAPLTAKFWDGKDYTIEASTEDGSIVIDDPWKATIYIPKGVADGGHIVFSNFAGETITDFIYRDTRNMLITNDDEDYLDKFNDGKPDIDFIGKENFVEKVNSTAQNTNGNFSVFWDNNFTVYTYLSGGESNDTGVEPKYKTPFGIFEESIVNGETTFNDYVIKFEVYVDESNPMIGNSLSIGFFDYDPTSIREYCAVWQPSRIYWNTPIEGDWTIKDLEPWHTNGDWMTVTIPMEEIKINMATKNYLLAAKYNRYYEEGREWYESPYIGFGDQEGGLPFFEKKSNMASLIKSGRAKDIRGIGLIYASYDEPISDYEPFIAIDNLRIVPKDNNGGVWPMLNWGRPSRDFYLAPVYNCK